jgi:hypothetical protein
MWHAWGEKAENKRGSYHLCDSDIDGRTRLNWIYLIHRYVSGTKIVFVYTILQYVLALSGYRQVLYIHLSTLLLFSPSTGQCITYGRGCIVSLTDYHI